MNEPEPSLSRIRLRALLAFALVVGLNVGPFYSQVLGGTPRLAPTWRMFSGIGLGLITVAYTHGQGPDATVIDHDRIITRPSGRRLFKRIESKKALRTLNREVCWAFPKQSRDIHLVANRATRSGWQVINDGSEPICNKIGPKPKRGRSSGRRTGSKR